MENKNKNTFFRDKNTNRIQEVLICANKESNKKDIEFVLSQLFKNQ